MLKGYAGSICSYLSTLFNCSLSLGRVPQDWKISNITPILKSGEPSLISNYRPISLLHCLKDSGVCYPQFFNVACPSARLFGFRPGSSTQEAILSATRDGHEILGMKGSVVCVFFDLSKAFGSATFSDAGTIGRQHWCIRCLQLVCGLFKKSLPKSGSGWC